MAAERTFIAIKPDGVQRGLVGEILGQLPAGGELLEAHQLEALALEA
ncbi:MAG: nucleoside-diphosphate kinase, partial [Cyanobium sp.]